MNIKFTNKAFEDFSYWLNFDKRKAKRILELMKDIQKHPFEGIGKPEALKYKIYRAIIPEGLTSNIDRFNNLIMMNWLLFHVDIIMNNN